MRIVTIIAALLIVSSCRDAKQIEADNFEIVNIDTAVNSFHYNLRIEKKLDSAQLVSIAEVVRETAKDANKVSMFFYLPGDSVGKSIVYANCVYTDHPDDNSSVDFYGRKFKLNIIKR